MSDEIGTVRYQFDDYGNKIFSDLTYSKIDKEITSIIQSQFERCLRLIKDKKELINRMSEQLMEKDTLTFLDVQAIFGPRPFPIKKSFQSFIEEVERMIKEPL